MATVSEFYAEVSLRSLTPGDLPLIAGIHLRAFPGSALSRLGRGAVERYYRWQLEGPHDAIALGADYQGVLVGYIFAGVFRGATGGFVRKNAVYLAARVLLTAPFLRDRRFWSRVFTGLVLIGRMPLRRPTRSSSRQPVSGGVKKEPNFGCLAIAVEPQYQRLGAGAKLMAAMDARARECGVRQVELTVEPANQRAVAFYQKLGWVRSPSGEQWRGLMTKAL